VKKLCCTTNCYHPFTLERALKGISGLGIREVELNAIYVAGHGIHIEPARMKADDIKKLKQLLEQYGLKAVSMAGHCNLLDAEERELFKARLKVAHALGITIVNTGAGEGKGKEARNKALDVIKQLAGVAGDLGITIALETHGHLTGTGALCLEIMQALALPNVRVNYDPANVIFYTGGVPEEDIKLIAKYVAHVHVKDKASRKLHTHDFPPIGEGIIDFSRIFCELDKVGYNGPLSLEVELDGNPATPEIVDKALGKSMEYLKTMG